MQPYTRHLTRLTLTLGLFLAACGASDKGPDPVEACDDFVQSFCVKIVNCAPSEGPIATCVADVRTVFSCTTVHGLGPHHGACLRDWAATPCDVITSALATPDASPLPASCRRGGAFLR